MGDPPEFVVGGLVHGVEDPPGLVVLFGGKVIEWREKHEGPFV